MGQPRSPQPGRIGSMKKSFRCAQRRDAGAAQNKTLKRIENPDGKAPHKYGEYESGDELAARVELFLRWQGTHFGEAQAEGGHNREGNDGRSKRERDTLRFEAG